MKKFAIIGYPLEHSFSPKIHNAAFSELGISAVYEKFEIAPDQFKETIPKIKNGDWYGFNVTIPYKQSIIPFLDAVEPVTKKIGAVNTIRVRGDGSWLGFNTDYQGFLHPIAGNLKNFKKVIMIGAGGAARAVAFGLLSHCTPEELAILNRSLENARALAGHLSEFDKTKVTIQKTDDTGALHFKADLIINTTSVGMGSRSGALIIDPVPFCKMKTIVYDLIYNPAETRFLRRARQAGFKTINGLPMLLGQAAEAFKIWTGRNFPERVLKDLQKAF